MTFFILNKETDELLDVLENLSPEDIEKFERENPDKYIQDENYLKDEDFNEDVLGYDDIW